MHAILGDDPATATNRRPTSQHPTGICHLHAHIISSHARNRPTTRQMALFMLVIMQQPLSSNSIAIHLCRPPVNSRTSPAPVSIPFPAESRGSGRRLRCPPHHSSSVISAMRNLKSDPCTRFLRAVLSFFFKRFFSSLFHFLTAADGLIVERLFGLLRARHLLLGVRRRSLLSFWVPSLLVCERWLSESVPVQCLICVETPLLDC